MIDDCDRESITGIHRLQSRREALADWTERIEAMLTRGSPSSSPPPPTAEDLLRAETLDVEPDELAPSIH